jgi:hypothetical protein
VDHKIARQGTGHDSGSADAIIASCLIKNPASKPLTDVQFVAAIAANDFVFVNRQPARSQDSLG